ncbi:ATP-binding cassette subfamily B protein [Paucibacter oligotrophus]|uniref:ATP-binding cassette subfamily B protein n=1 Tax=Roseateles oligotrophus TaxID=1769250 RepID=A0A840LEN3_9BURK|nr:ABC transporter ATP-binding protein [Roseateles oligotrophus]MBB4846151.1 ATP-binding cassette subfamily B protein [Roseateles oligotrophus]
MSEAIASPALGEQIAPPADPAQNDSKGALRWLLAEAAPYRWLLGTGLLLGLLSSALSLVPAWSVQHLVQGLLLPGAARSSDWLALGGIVLAALFLRNLSLMGATLLMHRAAFDLLNRLRSRLLASLAGWPLGAMTRAGAAQQKKLVGEDVEQIERFVAHQLLDLSMALATPLLAAALMASLDWRLALLSLLVWPAALVAQAWMYRDVGPRMQRYFELRARMHASMQDLLRALPLVKSMGRGLPAYQRYSQDVQAFGGMVRQWIAATAPGMAAFRLALDCHLLVLLPAGLWMYAQGHTGLPELVAVLVLAQAVPDAITALLMLGGHLQQVLMGAGRVQACLAVPALPEPEQPEPLPPGPLTLQFKGVGLRYEAQGPWVLQDINVDLRPGTLTALVGPSGSGKSSLASLLGRFNDPQRGQVLLNGVDLRELGSAQVLAQAAFVFQDTFLLWDTLRANLCMGREASAEAIETALRRACAWDFVQALPQGLETVLGQGGASLSGGERQRLALARALLRDAPLLVLDEATAFADAGTEAQIQHILSELLRDRTVLMIAHRLSSLRNAEQVLVLEAGRLRARGRHAQLMQEDAAYARLWAQQDQAAHWAMRKNEGERDV